MKLTSCLYPIVYCLSSTFSFGEVLLYTNFDNESIGSNAGTNNTIGSTDFQVRNSLNSEIVQPHVNFVKASGHALQLRTNSNINTGYGAVTPAGGASDLPTSLSNGDIIKISFDMLVQSLPNSSNNVEFQLRPNNVNNGVTEYNFTDLHSAQIGEMVSVSAEFIVGSTGGLNTSVTSINPFLHFDGVNTNYTENINIAQIDNLTIKLLPLSDTKPQGVTTDPELSDLDNNGLPDLWEAIYQANNLDPSFDSDSDGVLNSVEAAFGSDPFNPNSKIDLKLRQKTDSSATLSWQLLPGRAGTIQSSTDIGDSDSWSTESINPTINSNSRSIDIVTNSERKKFYRIMSSSEDTDGDGISDWIEPLLGFSATAGDQHSALQQQSYDTNGDGNNDTSLAGDLSAYSEIYRPVQSGQRLSRAQSARLLLQTTFGPASMDEVNHVANIGAEAWIDEQIATAPTLHQPYIDALKDDLDLAPSEDYTDPLLRGYSINSTASPYVSGSNYPTTWLRSSISGPDQLRQRVAFALSQILVASRNGAGLPNSPRSAANYYDNFVENAFGNFEDILLNVSLHPFMGHYLSHLGNRKSNPTIGRFPDENYAREIMQLFSIGLWELNPDGSQKLNSSGDPIPTYNNTDITNVANIFTGVNYASNNFGGGYKDDGDSSGQWMTTPMKVFSSEHDWTSKSIPIGYDQLNNQRLYYTIDGRTSGRNNNNARAEVVTLVNQLVQHPNCAPFICRQLIQFLVTSNPSPNYVERVASTFVNNGTGVTGDMEAVIKAILLDEEARNPLNHLSTDHFGLYREPVIKLVHLYRTLKVGRHSKLLWHDFGFYESQSLQLPMSSPSVFNFFRPDYRLFGSIASNELDSPALGIVNSYSAISFPNLLWRACEVGIKHPNGNSLYDGQSFPPDYSELEALAGNIPDLLDHLSILNCAGTLGAQSREIISNTLASEPNLTDRARLAIYLTLVCPEGSILK